MCVSIFTQLSVVINTADHGIHHTVLGKKYHIHCLSSSTLPSLSSLSGFSVYWRLLIEKWHLHGKFKQYLFHVVLVIKASACRFTQVKTIDNSIRTFPTQRQFEGFLLNSSENISTLHHTLWQYIHVFTSDTITQFFSFLVFLNQPNTP